MSEIKLPPTDFDHYTWALKTHAEVNAMFRDYARVAVEQDRAGRDDKNWRNWWCPDVCPITGLPFFVWIQHPEGTRWVPTYGGPYDSYTIPVKQEDGSFCRERYDHDLGGWLMDELEDVGVQIVSDQAYVSDEHPEQQAQSAVELAQTAHDWIRHALQLPDDAPRRFDFYAQEIEKLRAQRRPLTESKIRAAFEHWFSDEGSWPGAIARSGNNYKLAQTQAAWTAWLASAKAHGIGEQAQGENSHD